MLYANNRLHGVGKVNTGVTTKLSEIKSCNRIVKNHNWGSIHPAPQYRFQTSLSE
jgi:hypothetical protein